ncbi:MAG: hypothetical protein QM680_04740 [Luteolibacter sp.]
MAEPDPIPEKNSGHPSDSEETPVIRLSVGSPSTGKFQPSGRAGSIPVQRISTETSASQPKRPRVNRSGKISQAALNAPTVPAAEAFEETWGSTPSGRNHLPWFWILSMLLVGGGLILWAITASSKDPEIVSNESTKPADPADFQNPDSEKQALEQVKIIEATVRGYCAAATVQERAKFIRDPKRVTPLMKTYYPDGKVPSFRVNSIELNALTLENRADFWIVALDTGSGPAKKLIVESGSPSSAAVDWEVDVVWQPVPWEQFASLRDENTYSFRVMAQKSVLFSHEFADEKRWQSYKLNTPGNLKTIYGYCPRNGEIDLKISELIRANNDAPVMIILDLKRPANLQSPAGALIDAVRSENWVRIDHSGS